MAQKVFSRSMRTRKPLSSNWKLYVWCSSLLMLCFIVGFLLFTQQVSIQAQAGAAVTETPSLNILPLLIIALVIGIANSIIYPFLLLKRKVSVTWKTILVALFIPALLIALGGLYTVTNSISESVKNKQSKEQTIVEFQADELKKYKEQIPAAISADEATLLLQACKVVGFYYTAQNQEPINAERSITGILSVYLGSDNYDLHIAERHEATMVPLARDTRPSCLGKPQLWHNGRYE